MKRTVEAGKPVVVSMGNVAASGGYYISANATRIFAEPATITGSIGVVSVAFNFADTLAKLGIHTDGVRLSESGGTLDPFEPFRERDLDLVREQVQAMYQRFVAAVARGRKMEPAAVEAIGSGRVWTGREAVGNGLVDALGDTRPDSIKAIDAALGPYAREVLGFIEMGVGPLYYCPYTPAGE
ncbi:MAG: S49 family peptidase [Spirochaetales bacterium]|nr:S49 family peptidase [Spirochaetales bacterium]